MSSNSPEPGFSGSVDKSTNVRSGTVSVIIPTLNEAGNLPYVLNTIPEWVHEVILVDGRSDDDTKRIAM
ncbi:MAG TPA: glycosyltransferase, partial [Acidimicrobiales bacterium]